MKIAKWKKKWSKEGEYDSGSMQTLSDIARGMQYCVNSTSEILERQHIERLNRFFDSEGYPLTQKFRMRNGTCMEIPLITMMGENTLLLDEMMVKMTLSVKELVPKDSTVSVGDEKDRRENFYSRTAFKVTLASSSVDQENLSNVDLEMRFKSGDSPEAVARIMERFTNAITVVNEKGERID